MLTANVTQGQPPAGGGKASTRAVRARAPRAPPAKMASSSRASAVGMGADGSRRALGVGRWALGRRRWGAPVGRAPGFRVPPALQVASAVLGAVAPLWLQLAVALRAAHRLEVADAPRPPAIHAPQIVPHGSSPRPCPDLR